MEYLYKKDIHYTLKIKLISIFYFTMLDELIELLSVSIQDDAPYVLNQGNIVKKWYDPFIDDARNFIAHGENWIAEYQKKLIEETGINLLKIKYTQNTGYFIEIWAGKEKNIPEYFKHVQSLMQVKRYTTSELEDFNHRSDSVLWDLYQREYECFLKIREAVEWYIQDIYVTSQKIRYLDFITNGAYIAQRFHYSPVKFTDEKKCQILAGKHPVISQVMTDFISNEISFDKKNFIGVLTWPNMWGKSTYLRQNALLIIMAHMGYEIPCESATLSLVDKIFSRVWAGDNLYLGQSTFMVEMQEISYIVRNATEKSFIIIDEIGRGTSTYDGMSLAWAILEYIYREKKSFTLFATHYHEIAEHAKWLPGIENYSVAVGENEENIIFLRKIIPGAMKKSYGIEVAQLAGIPTEILEHAKAYHKKVSQKGIQQQLYIDTENSWEVQKYKDMVYQYKTLFEEISNIDINALSPMLALQKLDYYQERIKNIKKFE